MVINHLFKSSLVGSALRSAAGVVALALSLVASADSQVTTPKISAAIASSGIDTPSADFGNHKPSVDARFLADRVAQSRDNGNAEFIIVDKRNARLYVFDAFARLRGSTPVLLGAAFGDYSAPDIGSRPLADVKPEERTTPAGRFLAERGHDINGADVVWVDYDASVSIHRVITSSPKERRLQRLATATVADNRISWGCINVPVAFYESRIRPIFATRRAMVYVLPDVTPVREIFHF